MENNTVLFSSKKDDCETVKTLLQENKKYKEVIDKAIEYIDKNSVYFAELHKLGNYFINVNADKLLDILKGNNE